MSSVHLHSCCVQLVISHFKLPQSSLWSRRLAAEIVVLKSRVRTRLKLRCNEESVSCQLAAVPSEAISCSSALKSAVCCGYTSIAEPVQQLMISNHGESRRENESWGLPGFYYRRVGRPDQPWAFPDQLVFTSECLPGFHALPTLLRLIILR